MAGGGTVSGQVVGDMPAPASASIPLPGSRARHRCLLPCWDEGDRGTECQYLRVRKCLWWFLIPGVSAWSSGRPFVLWAAAVAASSIPAV